MKIVLAVVIIVAAMSAAPFAWAEGNVADVTDMQALRAAVRSDKKALVASTLQLTEAEAKKFWPIYDSYQRTVDVANRERTLVIVDIVELNKPASDLYARDLAKELVAADETEVKARRTLFGRVMKALPAKKAARYLQLESKIRAVQAYDVAQAIPLIK